MRDQDGTRRDQPTGLAPAGEGARAHDLTPAGVNGCGAASGLHGDSSGLTATERADLLAYLRVL